MNTYEISMNNLRIKLYLKGVFAKNERGYGLMAKNK